MTFNNASRIWPGALGHMIYISKFESDTNTYNTKVCQYNTVLEPYTILVHVLTQLELYGHN